MFELPEIVNLGRQLNEAVAGKVVRGGTLGNSPHKFVWYNRSSEEFGEIVKGKKIGKASSRGRWLFIELSPGYNLVFGEIGGKMLLHAPESALPKKYHLALFFEDGSFLTETTQMWGAMELYETGKEQSRQYIKDMRTTPTEAEFTFDYFDNLIANLPDRKSRTVKGLLTQNQIIPGIGNSIAQDIMFNAGLHPKFPLKLLDGKSSRRLYDSIRGTLDECIERGGRTDEWDLFGSPGGYRRLMDVNAVGKPCPSCGAAVRQMSYLGGACYFCESCQRLS